MPMLTKKQKKILDFITSYIKQNGISPTIEEIAHNFKRAVGTIHEHLEELVNKGFIKKNKSARGIELEKKSKMVYIPLIGTIAAGQPIEALQEKETLAISKDRLPKSGNIFALKVVGDSMIEDEIHNGDYVVVKQQSSADNGERVVALIDQTEVTLKKFYKEKDKIRLQPANQNFLPLHFDRSRVDIQGVVVDVVKTNERQNNFEPQKIISNTKKNHVELKPYYNKPTFTLYNSDCLSLLAQLPENSVDMIFADPPYNLSNGGFTVHAGRMVSVNKGDWDKSKGFKDDYDFHYKWMDACKRVLKPGGTLWVSGTYHSIYQCGHALQSLGYHILNDIAWFKPNASPNLSCRFFTASHETLIWARKDKKAKHIFNYGLMKNGDWPHDSLKKPGLQMRSVWSIGTPKPLEKTFGKHPTQKPVDLLQRIVLSSTNKGDIVVDPFTGSSTTGIAACFHGRKFIGIDTEKKFLDLSIKRFEELERNLKK